MALPINVNDLLNGKVVEWERLEFKEGWNPEDTLHSICAFANDVNNWGGGYIIIGVEEQDGIPKLPPKGLNQNQLDPIQKKLFEICHRITPNYFPLVEPYIFEGKHILILWIPGGDTRPYKAPEFLQKNVRNLFWLRRYSNTVKANREEEQLLLSLTAKVPFDDRINHHAQIEHFELNLIREFLNEINSDYTIQGNTSVEEICNALQIGRGPREYLKPVNVGLLFFTSDPARFFPYTKIEIVEFIDDVGDNLIEKSFGGPLHIQIRSALQYIKNSIIKEKVQKVSGKAEAVRLFNFPYAAIEEALVNAVYHKSYEVREPIEVSIRKDRIEILSFPGSLPPIDNESLKQFRVTARTYRNRRIGDFLKELNLTEGKATGIPKIRESMKKNGSPDPVFQMDQNRTYFLTTIPMHSDFYTQTANRILDQVGTKTGLSGDQVKIMRRCASEAGIVELMNVIGRTNRTKFRNQVINPLIEEKLIAMTIPDKPTSSSQKYRLTQNGKTLLEKKTP